MSELYESWLATDGGPVSHRPHPGAVTVSDIASRGHTLADLARYREQSRMRTWTWNIFEGDVPPYAVHGTHVAAHCTSCDWAVWTFRATDAGIRELQRRKDEHVQQTHEAITQIIPVVVNHAPVTA